MEILWVSQPPESEEGQGASHGQQDRQMDAEAVPWRRIRRAGAGKPGQDGEQAQGGERDNQSCPDGRQVAQQYLEPDNEPGSGYFANALILRGHHGIARRPEQCQPHKNQGQEHSGKQLSDNEFFASGKS